jgi:hypothetical protein
VPLSRGGDSEDLNLQTLCRRCNRRKWKKLVSRTRPSSVTQREIAGSEETENPWARRGCCALSDPADSLRVSRNRLDSGRKCPTYVQLFWTRRGMFFKSPMLSRSCKSWAQVWARTRGNASSMTLCSCWLLAIAATLPEPTSTSRVRADRQWRGIPVQPKATARSSSELKMPRKGDKWLSEGADLRACFPKHAQRRRTHRRALGSPFERGGHNP